MTRSPIELFWTAKNTTTVLSHQKKIKRVKYEIQLHTLTSLLVVVVDY